MSTLQQQSLSGPKGQVHALAVTEEGLLFAGTQVSCGHVWQHMGVGGRGGWLVQGGGGCCVRG